MHLLRFKVIRDKLKKRRIYLNSFNGHFLSFKVVRDTVKCIRHGTHYFVAHFLLQKWSGTNSIMNSLLRTASLHISCVFKMVRDIRQWEWFYPHCFVTHLLCLKVLWCSGIVTIQLVMFIYALRIKWASNVMDRKKADPYAHNYSVSFFSSSGKHQSHYLDRCQELVRFLLLFFPFEPCIFDNHHATYQI